MKTLKRLFSASVILFISILLTGCIPPVFYTQVKQYAVDNGSDVTFSVSASNKPTSVTCFGGNVVMVKQTSSLFQGTASYSSDLTHPSGKNTVICTATNQYGKTTTNLGFIHLIPDVPPVLALLPTQTVCGNDGSKAFNEPLIDVSGTSNVAGATYTLSAGSLPAGLGIDAANGKLVGNSVAGDFNPSGLKITATTVAGSTESAAFSIIINQADC